MRSTALRLVLWLTFCLLLTAACQTSATPTRRSSPEGDDGMQLSVSSQAFPQGGDIPPQYTCDGADISPPLAWSEPPERTQSLALICDDPDAPAGTWVHWVMYNLPPSTRALSQGVSPEEQLSDGSMQGVNDFRRLGYRGPCPPRGPKHQYSFRIYAIDSHLELVPGATKAQLLQAMEGHVVAQGETVGMYGR